MQFEQSNIEFLQRELENVDISTNIFYNTVNEMIPLISIHSTLGLIVKKHPDIKDAVEFIDMKVGSIAHNNVKNWKRRLRGTILTKVDGETVTSVPQMKKVIEKAKHKKLQKVNTEFGSLKAFAINGAGIPTLQADQLNVIAHHINAINMNNQKMQPYINKMKQKVLMQNFGTTQKSGQSQ